MVMMGVGAAEYVPINSLTMLSLFSNQSGQTQPDAAPWWQQAFLAHQEHDAVLQRPTTTRAPPGPPLNGGGLHIFPTKKLPQKPPDLVEAADPASQNKDRWADVKLEAPIQGEVKPPVHEFGISLAEMTPISTLSFTTQNSRIKEPRTPTPKIRQYLLREEKIKQLFHRFMQQLNIKNNRKVISYRSLKNIFFNMLVAIQSLEPEDTEESIIDEYASSLAVSNQDNKKRFEMDLRAFERTSTVIDELISAFLHSSPDLTTVSSSTTLRPWTFSTSSTKITSPREESRAAEPPMDYHQMIPSSTTTFRTAQIDTTEGSAPSSSTFFLPSLEESLERASLQEQFHQRLRIFGGVASNTIRPLLVNPVAENSYPNHFMQPISSTSPTTVTTIPDSSAHNAIIQLQRFDSDTPSHKDETKKDQEDLSDNQRVSYSIQAITSEIGKNETNEMNKTEMPPPDLESASVNDRTQELPGQSSSPLEHRYQPDSDWPSLAPGLTPEAATLFIQRFSRPAAIGMNPVNLTQQQSDPEGQDVKELDHRFQVDIRASPPDRKKQKKKVSPVVQPGSVGSPSMLPTGGDISFDEWKSILIEKLTNAVASFNSTSNRQSQVPRRSSQPNNRQSSQPDMMMGGELDKFDMRDMMNSYQGDPYKKLLLNAMMMHDHDQVSTSVPSRVGMDVSTEGLWSNGYHRPAPGKQQQTVLSPPVVISSIYGMPYNQSFIQDHVPDVVSNGPVKIPPELKLFGDLYNYAEHLDSSEENLSSRIHPGKFLLSQLLPPSSKNAASSANSAQLYQSSSSSSSSSATLPTSGVLSAPWPLHMLDYGLADRTRSRFSSPPVITPLESAAAPPKQDFLILSPQTLPQPYKVTPHPRQRHLETPSASASRLLKYMIKNKLLR